MRRIRRPWTVLVTLIALITVAAAALGTACATPTVSPGSAPVSDSQAQVPTELASFYSQKVAWDPCRMARDAQCAWLDVPIDYANPSNGTVRLRMLKLPARGGKAAHGALFVNPGGPGGSAMEYAAYGDGGFSASVRRNFDLVGVDPRGVGQSNPITCVDPKEMDTILGFDPTPDNAAERARLKQLSAEFGKSCQQRYPQLAGHVSTIEAAKDMDIARAAMGQPKLSYLGKSYGTFLGATYAGLFPNNVGRMVLDGALPPDLTDEELNLGQAEGFEAATRAYVADCVTQSDCPLGRDVDGGMKRLADFLHRLDEHPLPVRGDPRVTQLTEGWGSVGLAEAMYDQGLWAYLTPALAEAMNGDGTRLFEFAKQYARRNGQGGYDGNIMQVISVINCIDRGAKPRSEEEIARLTQEYTAKAPTWGRFMVNGSSMCEGWPVPATGKIEKVSAEGSPAIVVVGTTRDPATPYAWSERLASQLANGHLITFDGDGHTAYMRSNNCVDNAVDGYLIDGKTPADGLRC